MTSRRAGLTAVMLALAGLTGCIDSGTGPEVEFRVPVSVRDVVTGTVEDRIVATGSLRASEVVVLRAETAGVLEISRRADGRRLREGDPVEPGQVVAVLKGDDVRLAARTEATRTRYLEAQRDYESKKRLYEDGLIAEYEFRPAEAALAEAKLEWERSRLTETRSNLTTPISGLILKLARDDQNLPMADGQLVDPGFIVAQIAPVDILVADVDVIGPDVARVVPGQEARVAHHAFEDRVFEGRVLRLAPSLDPLTRTLRAEVEVDNAGRQLRPGMFVEVTVIAERRADVPVVPREAVTEREGKTVVFVLDGQKAEQRSVVLGLGDDADVEVREGVEPGERVVVRGLETLSDGVRVRVTGT